MESQQEKREDKDESNLYLKLCQAFIDDPQIDEYEFLPPEILQEGCGDDLNLIETESESKLDNNRNFYRNEDLYIICNHKLAISSSYKKSLFLSAKSQYEKIIRQNKKERREGALKEDQNYMINKLTKCILMINADIYTLWNERKKILSFKLEEFYLNVHKTLEIAKISMIPTTNKTSTLDSPSDCLHSFKCSEIILSEFYQEFIFLNLVFSKHMKKTSAWAHRRWCFLQYKKLIFYLLSKVEYNIKEDGKEHFHSSDKLKLKKLLKELIEMEYILCNLVASRSERNYYVWTHRLVVTRIMVLEGPLYIVDLVKENFQNEIEYIYNWCKHNISDGPAFHYYSELIVLLYRTQIKYEMNYYLDLPSSTHNQNKSIITSFFKFLDLVHEGGNLCSDILKDFPLHESMWYFLRRIVSIHICLLQDLLKLFKEVHACESSRFSERKKRYRDYWLKLLFLIRKLLNTETVSKHTEKLNEEFSTEEKMSSLISHTSEGVDIKSSEFRTRYHLWVVWQVYEKIIISMTTNSQNSNGPNDFSVILNEVELWKEEYLRLRSSILSTVHDPDNRKGEFLFAKVTSK